MITKAFIEEIIDQYNVRVRIPFYNKVASSPNCTPTNELYIASISTIPNCSMNYKVGDIVFVGFEDHNIGKPVILGQLSRENYTENYSTINAETLRANVDAYLPYNTTIGDIKSSEIACLQGADKNLQFQIKILSERIAKLEEMLNTRTQSED